MNRILRSLIPVFGIASIVMFFAWCYNIVSGWIWFSCLLIYTFLCEYDEK